MTVRPLMRTLVAAAMLGACSVPAHAVIYYDPFPDAASIKPVDELEERLWDEAEALRGQFVRGRPGPAVEVMQRIVRGVVLKIWPELSPRLNVYVIDNADVMALSSANGDIILSTGMLLRLDSEQELQVILAREIAHVTHRHALRSVHAARLAAGAKVIFETATDAADLASTVTGVAGAADAVKAGVKLFKVSPEMLLSSGRALVQDQLNKLKENMADSLIRSVSATGFGAVVKTSLFGYSESLEAEADAFAMRHAQDHLGSTEVYRRVMQRLMDEALLDEKKFSAFYANEDRLYRRLASVKRFDEERGAAASAPAMPSKAPTADAVTPDPTATASAAAALPAGSVELAPLPQVATVVLDEGGSLPADPMPAEPAYPSALGQIALPVLEGEFESGRLGRLIRNIERPRDAVKLPDRVKGLLAESYAASPDPAQTARAEELARDILADHPDDARMLKLLGLAALKKGQATEAKTWLSKAREHADSDDERGFLDQYIRQADKKLSAL